MRKYNSVWNQNLITNWPLRKVVVRPDAEYSRIVPEGLPCRIYVLPKGGRIVAKEKRGYEGFFTRPMSWEKVGETLTSLCPSGMKKIKSDIIDAVDRLEEIEVADLMRFLAKVSCGNTRRSP